MIYDDIRAALESHLQGVVGLPAVAYQNLSFTETTGVPYVKATLVPTSRRPAVVGTNPQQRYNGLFSILICTPADRGSSAGYKYADIACKAFDATTDLSYGSLVISLDYAEVGASYYDSTFYCTPVTVGWHTYYKET